MSGIILVVIIILFAVFVSSRGKKKREAQRERKAWEEAKQNDAAEHLRVKVSYNQPRTSASQAPRQAVPAGAGYANPQPQAVAVPYAQGGVLSAAQSAAAYAQAYERSVAASAGSTANKHRVVQANTADAGSSAQPHIRAASPSVTAHEQASIRAASPNVSTPSEGSFSTEGETEAEHAMHELRAAANEARDGKAYNDIVNALHGVRRQSLRTAIVMSEILDKPVALRKQAEKRRW